MLHINYNRKNYSLQAKVEYHSQQIMRIRVYGMKTTLLLENNYPVFKKRPGAFKWKLREGSMKEATPESSRLLIDIMMQLERLIKQDFPPNALLNFD